jgi:nucleoside-diphosphate-sugar epimerase
MRAFITGATGYIGGTVAARLQEAGWQVAGLTRSEASAEALRSRGIEPVVGSLNDEEIIRSAALEADVVVNAADSDHAFVVATLVEALAGSGKKFIHTSGSSVVADRAAGGADAVVHDEDHPRANPVLEKRARIAIDQYVQEAARTHGIHSVVICPTMIYGRGLGLHEESIQVPALMDLAREKGVGTHIGAGENIWSNVHILDLADLYLKALDQAPAGSFYFAENGEASLKSIAQAISQLLGFGERTSSLPMAEAIRRWGPDAAYFGLASNSRVSSAKARRELGWNPQHHSLIDEILNGHYRAVQAAPEA